jgi:signal peptidase I
VNLLVVGGFIGCLLYLHLRVVRVAYVPTKSMAPTLQVGDRVLVYLGAYRRRPPQHGDIIVFRPPHRSGYEVKRVIAVGGDTLVIMWGLAFRNGHALIEPYIAKPMVFERPLGGRLKPGQLFVMGDNRNDSEDSRDWGPVDEKRVLGRVFFRLLPLSRAGSASRWPREKPLPAPAPPVVGHGAPGEGTVVPVP